MVEKSRGLEVAVLQNLTLGQVDLDSEWWDGSHVTSDEGFEGGADGGGGRALHTV
jgi:hypothetical protein